MLYYRNIKFLSFAVLAVLILTALPLGACSPKLTAPAAPSELSTNVTGATRVDLSWKDNSDDESGFLIHRAINSTFTSGLTSFTVGAGVTTYSDSSVVAATEYYYRVAASNTAGDSSFSNVVTVAIPAAIDAAAIYSASCASCHGANRQDGPRSAITAADLADWQVSDLISYLANHSASKNITAEQREALANWLKTTP